MSFDHDGPLLPASLVDQIQVNEPLSRWCTLELGGPARWFLSCSSTAVLRDAIHWAQDKQLSIVWLGGGSNVVIADEGIDALVIRLAHQGIRHESHASQPDHVSLRVAAGHSFDALVAHAVQHDLAGIECLSGIPGTVGGTPIQNVGAYGQEVSQTIRSLTVLDPHDGSTHVVDNASCAFEYRDSALRTGNSWLRRAVVLDTVFELRAGARSVLRYGELERALSTATNPSLAHVRDTVIRLRRAKSMVLDPSDENRRSVGSFFTNPIVSPADADRVIDRALQSNVAARAHDIPTFSTEDGRVKLAAGWLIERAGIQKGMRRGPVGVSTRHALALVHNGQGTTRQLMSLAHEIQQRVQETWGVTLSTEPVFLG